MSEPSTNEYQPRTPERLIEVLNALDPNPRSVYWEAARTIERLLATKPERERVIEECAQIAEAIDSGRGNERAIAKSIRALKGDPASTVAHLPNVVVTKQEW